MRRLRRILVGVAVTADGRDVAPSSRKAAEQALELGQRTGASLAFLHSRYREADSIAWHGRAVSPSDAAAAAEQRLGELRDELARDGDAVGLTFTSDRPWLDLIRAVLRDEADLVVVGRGGDEGAHSRRIGSVSMKLLRKCPAPVWVVHPGQKLHDHRIVAATDLSAVGDLATRFAADLAQSYDSDLHIIHSYAIGLQLQMELAPLDGKAYAARIRELERDVERRIREGLGEYDAVGGRLHIGCTTPWKAISEALERLRPELLVMGTLSRGGIGGLLVGNTAERILNHVDCSLLTIKPEDFVSPVTL